MELRYEETAPPPWFADYARVPADQFDGIEDNVAVATRDIPAGTVLRGAPPSGGALPVQHQVLTGHRFTLLRIAAGEALRSWGQPFGVATRAIRPGEFTCNSSIIEALSLRGVDAALLPRLGNFRDLDHSVRFCVADEAAFVAGPASPTLPDADRGSFMGFMRPGARGVGTRNVVAVIGTTARSAALVRAVCRDPRVVHASRRARREGAFDGVVAIVHTEAGGEARGDALPPRNLSLVLRTLSGMLAHANVGAALVVDSSCNRERDEWITCASLRRSMEDAVASAGLATDHPPADPHPHDLRYVDAQWRSLTGAWRTDVERCVEVLLSGLIPRVAAHRRVACPLSALRLALQCGGSDAFSGVAANPLAGHVARHLIAHGGVAVQAETDELIGAESYFLSSVKSHAIAARFAAFVARFKRRLSAHGGLSAEGNVSGGNKFRGLYNITLKSLGAAFKKAPCVRLDGVLEYAEALTPKQHGFYFMDSPGNDLESTAGQVATGCNAVIFTTGNGAITNHPLVPTIKIVSTSSRFSLLHGDMDVNAGRCIDSAAALDALRSATPACDPGHFAPATMPQLAEETFALLRNVASGERSVGELAGHSQISIWRDWCFADAADDAADAGERSAVAKRAAAALQREAERVAAVAARVPRERVALARAEARALLSFASASRRADAPAALDRIALIVPSSLCSGEVARMCAATLNCELLGAATDELTFAVVERPLGAAHAVVGGSGSAARESVATTPTAAAAAAEAPLAPFVAVAARAAGSSLAVRRFVALPHTEGCGSAGNETLYGDVLVGHICHPLVAYALVVEHGCEKQHNDAMAQRLSAHGVGDPAKRFGWCSVQLGGGIAAAAASVRRWFEGALAMDEAMVVDTAEASPQRHHLGEIVVAFAAATVSPLSPSLACALSRVVRTLVAAGGRVIIARDSPLLRSAEILDEVLEAHGDALHSPSLRFGQAVINGAGAFTRPPGVHVMASSRTSGGSVQCSATPAAFGVNSACGGAAHAAVPWAETISALGASGAQLIVALADRPVAGHSFVPTLVCTMHSAACPDADVVLVESDARESDGERGVGSVQRAAAWSDVILCAMRDVASRRVVTNAERHGHTAFQISRGRDGVSM